jgi:hypothetical protein
MSTWEKKPTATFPPAIFPVQALTAIANMKVTGANNIIFFPLLLQMRISFMQMGIRISVVFAGGKGAVGIYSPSRNLILQSDNLATDSLAIVYGSSQRRYISPGNYLFAFTADNTTAAFSGGSSTLLSNLATGLNDAQQCGETAGGGGATLPLTLPAGAGVFAIAAMPGLVFV